MILAYVFWHRPRAEVSRASYERALIAFQRSLAKALPVGLLASACLRAERLPWLEGETVYEDWYVVEGYSALGVLAEAAVGERHASAHTQAARASASGTAAIYRLLEGEPTLGGGVRLAAWISPPWGGALEPLEELLGDGLDAVGGTLWRRELALGPAPELCLLAGELPDGLRPQRIPHGWEVDVAARKAL